MVDVLQYIFVSIILLLILGAFISVLFNNNQRLSNIVSNLTVILASFSGIAFSVIFLFLEEFGLSKEKFSGSIEFGVKSSIDLINIYFRIDNLSAFFIFLISLISLIVSIYSIGYLKHYYNKISDPSNHPDIGINKRFISPNKRNLGYFGFLYNLFIASMLLVVTSGQLFYFLIVWEIMSLVSYFLVVYESEIKETQKAGIMYVVMTHIGTAFIMASFIILYKYSGQTSFSAIDPKVIPAGIKNLVFIFTLIGFGTKAGMIPIHIWLPKAHPAAPSNVSALMSAVMIKTAVYCIIRIVFGVLGAEYLWWGTVILIIGAVSTIFGIGYALMEINIKRLLAYSSVENIGIIFIGIGLSIISYHNGNTLIAALSMTAALLHVLNHSIFKSLLFMGAGAIHYSTKTKNMEKLGGLIKKMPYTAVFFLIGAVAISSIPPFNGFISEWLTYLSLFNSVTGNGGFLKTIIILVAAILAMAGVLVAYSFVKTFGIAFLGKPRTNDAADSKEVPVPMLLGMAIPAVLCFIAGVFPIPLIKIIDKINLQIMNISIMKNVNSVVELIANPVKINKSSISPFMLLVTGTIIILAVFYIVAFSKLKTKTRYYGTWDCGYKELNSKMQYSATGFSKPIRIIFRAVFRPQRELQINEGSSPYFIKSAKYQVSIKSILEEYFYEPLIKRVINFARRTRFIIQTGSIHTYLIYIFIVIIVMFVYYIMA